MPMTTVPKRSFKIRKTLTLVSLLAFPITINYFSPYLIIQGGFDGIVTGSLLLFLTQFLTALFLGRSFCSWVCPAGTVQACIRAVNDKPTGKRLNLIKYVIWVPWIAVIVLGFITAGGIRQVDPWYFTDHGISVANIYGYIVYGGVLLIVITVSLIAGRHGFCHGVCWMAPFMILGTRVGRSLRIPSRHLEARSEMCVACGKCSRICPMSIPVMDLVIERRASGMHHDECILCGDCVQVCPKDVLSITYPFTKR